MKRISRTLLLMIFTLACNFVTGSLLRPGTIHAQENEGDDPTGSYLVAAYIDVDGGYYLYGTSVVQSDDPEEDQSIGANGSLTQDGRIIASDFEAGDQRVQFSVSADGSITPGHTYGMQTDGYQCSEDPELNEGLCGDSEYIGGAYTSVTIPPLPQITSLSPYSVNQGDTGTLTINGTNLVQSSSDQLTLNYSGQGMPFTPTGTPSSTSAQFTYDFTGYDTGTYQISVTNNIGTSNQVNFSVTAPQNACTQSRTPNSLSMQIGDLGSFTPGNIFSVSLPTAVKSDAAVTATYGVASTPASIASSIASAVTRKYMHLGITAQAIGSTVMLQSRSTFGTIAASPNSPINIGGASAVSCIPPSVITRCDPTLLDYDEARNYSDGYYETARAHITRRHILGTPTNSPYITKYVTGGGPTAQKFAVVQDYNITTLLHDPFGTNGVHFHNFIKTIAGIEFGTIGLDGDRNTLTINELHLGPASSNGTCIVDTSFPIH